MVVYHTTWVCLQVTKAFPRFKENEEEATTVMDTLWQAAPMPEAASPATPPMSTGPATGGNTPTSGSSM